MPSQNAQSPEKSCLSPPRCGSSITANKYLIDKNRAKATKYFEDSIEWACSIHNAIANFVESLYKDTDLIISRNEQFFSNLSVVDQIVTLGLSFGDVDVPYLERIRQLQIIKVLLQVS